MIKTKFLHIGVTCKDPVCFEEFYSKHFGFTRARTVVMSDTKKLIFIKDKTGLCFEIFQAEEKLPFPQAGSDGPHYPAWRHIAFEVDDVNAKLIDMGDDAVISKDMVNLEKYTKNWKAVWLKDPEGNIIELCQNYLDE